MPLHFTVLNGQTSRLILLTDLHRCGRSTVFDTFTSLVILGRQVRPTWGSHPRAWCVLATQRIALEIYTKTDGCVLDETVRKEQATCFSNRCRVRPLSPRIAIWSEHYNANVTDFCHYVWNGLSLTETPPTYGDGLTIEWEAEPIRLCATTKRLSRESLANVVRNRTCYCV